MRLRFIFAITGLLVSQLSWSAELGRRNLEDCFQAALKRSELIANQSQLIVQAEEKYRQAIGSVLPSISGSASYLVQPSSPTNIFPSNQPLVKVTASQPLFQGFKEFAGMSQTKNTIAAQTYSKWQATVQLFLDTAQNFYTILSLEKDQKNVLEQLRLYDQRINELNQFVNIGRSRQSEILTAKTQRESVEVQSEQLQIQIETQREVFEFLTGFDKTTSLDDTELAPTSVSPLSTYLAEIEKRPDIRAAIANVSAAEDSIKIASGNHLPSVNLLGNYYFLRYGALENLKWDAQVTLTLPLFAGGLIQSNVRVAESQKEQNILALSRIRRSAQQEVGTLHHLLKGDFTLVESYSQITELAEKNYKTQLIDYKHGLVSNVDVLLALTSFQENKRNLDRARFGMKLNNAKIEAAIAHRPKNSY